MAKNATYKSIEEFLNDGESPNHKIDRIKYVDSTFLDQINSQNRLKFWLDLIHPSFSDSIKTFCRINRMKGIVLIPKRQKVLIEYDTLYFAKKMNENKSNEVYHVTNSGLSTIRSLIFMYMGNNKKVEYHRSWIDIAYVLFPLSNEIEELLILFSFLVETFKDFYCLEKNELGKTKVISEFYGLVSRENVSFYLGSSKKSSLVKTEFKSEQKFFQSENIDNLGLYLLVKSLAETWHATLFSSILYPKDCLVYWDMLFIYKDKIIHQFGLTILEKYNTELENLVENVTNNMNSEFKINNQNDSFYYTIPNLLTFLSKPLSSSIARSLFKESIKKLVKPRSIFNFSTKKDANLSPEMFSMVFIRDRLRLMANLRRKLMEGGLESGMTMLRMLNRIDEGNEMISLKMLIELLKEFQIEVTNSVIGRVFILVDQDKKGYLTKKELKNFICLMPEFLKGKLELFFKDEKKFKFIEPIDILDILISLEYSMCDNLTFIKGTIDETFAKIYKHFSKSDFTMELMLQFCSKDKHYIQFTKFTSIIDGKTEVDESNISEDEDDYESLNSANKKGNIYGSISNLSTTYIEKNRRFSTDATPSSHSKLFPNRVATAGNPSIFSQKTIKEKPMSDEDIDEIGPDLVIPTFNTLKNFWKY